MIALLFFFVSFFLFFYFIPFLIGYVLGRGWRVAVPSRGGGIVVAAYVGWMFLTWLREGYAPVSLTRLVTLEQAVTRLDLYDFATHLLLILLTFYVVYRGGARGTRLGWARGVRREGEAA